MKPNHQRCLFGALLIVGVSTFLGCEFEAYDYITRQAVITNVDSVTRNSFVVSWNEVFNAKDYVLEVSQDSSFVKKKEYKTQDLSIRIDDRDFIENYATYILRLSTTDQNDVSQSNYSEVVSVTLGPIEAPTIFISQNGQAPPTPHLKIIEWRIDGSRDDSVTYEYQVAYDPLFEELVEGAGGTTARPGELIELPDVFRDYYIRVRANIQGSTSAWSETLILEANFSFTCQIGRLQAEDIDYRVKYKEDGTISNMELWYRLREIGDNGFPVETIFLLQDIWYIYEGGKIIGASIRDELYGNFVWEFVHNTEGLVQDFFVYDEFDEIIVTANFQYDDKGLTQQADLLYFEDSLVQYTFEYDELDNCIAQKGPEAASFTFTHSEVIAPEYLLPQEVQFMMYLTPESSLVFHDFVPYYYIPIYPKRRGITSASDAFGNTINVELSQGDNFLVNEALIEEMEVRYLIQNCR